MANVVSRSYKETGVDIINFLGRTRLGRVQSANMNANLPNTVIQELGSDRQVGRIFDLPEVTMTVSAIDVGARTVFHLANVDWATAPSGTYVEAQDVDYVCLAQTYKDKATDDIARTLFVPGARIESIALNYTVNGDATEEFSFNALDRRWLRYDAVIASGAISASGTLDTPGARVLKNGSYFLSAFASGVGYVPNESITTSDAGGVTFDIASGDFTAGDNVAVVYHADLADQWDYTYEYPHVKPGYTPPPDQPVGMRGFSIEVFLVKSGVSNMKVFRGQSATVNVAYNITRVNELGSEQPVGYTTTIPDVTGTLEIMQHDFRLLEELSGYQVGEEDWSSEELGSGDWGLEIRLWRRGANRLTQEPEKTVYIPTMDVTSEATTAQVGQDDGQTFNYSSRDGRVFFFKGFRPNTFFGG